MLVSTINPSVRGRSDSREKYRSVCGRPFSESEKSSLVRLRMSAPFLSTTVASRLTTFTSVEKVGSSCPCSSGPLQKREAAERTNWRREQRPSGLLQISKGTPGNTLSVRLDGLRHAFPLRQQALQVRAA